MNLQDMTQEQLIQLLATVLGSSVDSPSFQTGWRSTGGAAGRNALTTSERVITRLLNNMEGDLNEVTESVDGFNARVSRIVGDDGGADAAAFAAIGSNLIQAVYNLQKNGGPGGARGPAKWPIEASIANESDLPNGFKAGDSVVNVSNAPIAVFAETLYVGDVARVG